MSDALSLAAEAKQYLDEGDASYEKAAERMWRLRNEHGWTFQQIADAVARSTETVRVAVATHFERLANPAQTYTEARQKVKPSESQDARLGRTARQMLRDALPEQIASILLEPEIREKVEQAQGIVERSRERQREALGAEAVDALDEQQRLAYAEAEAFKARRALRDMLHLLDTSDVASARESWRDDFLRTLDDLAAKLDMARALVKGDDIDADLAALLAGEAS